MRAGLKAIATFNIDNNTAGRESEPKTSYVNSAEHGKPYTLPLVNMKMGRPNARKGYGVEGKGMWNKRMSVCNESDRGSNVTPNES